MGTHDANPKAISERTSYYQIRLAFHSLPQVIPACCPRVGSVLPPSFDGVQPAHGKLIWLRVLCMQLMVRAIHTRFRYCLHDRVA